MKQYFLITRNGILCLETRNGHSTADELIVRGYTMFESIHDDVEINDIDVTGNFSELLYKANRAIDKNAESAILIAQYVASKGYTIEKEIAIILNLETARATPTEAKSIEHINEYKALQVIRQEAKASAKTILNK